MNEYCSRRVSKGKGHKDNREESHCPVGLVLRQKASESWELSTRMLNVQTRKHGQAVLFESDVTAASNAAEAAIDVFRQHVQECTEKGEAEVGFHST